MEQHVDGVLVSNHEFRQLGQQLRRHGGGLIGFGLVVLGSVVLLPGLFWSVTLVAASCFIDAKGLHLLFVQQWAPDSVGRVDPL